MDPRPYHFEYRRPRLSNPTFESTHLYESIYDLKHLPLRTPQPSSHAATPDTQLTRAASTALSTKQNPNLAQPTLSRYESKPEGLAVSEREEGRSRVASYGLSLVRNSSMDQREVYRRQEKNFNIISCFPRAYEPALKQFPRLTLEDRLIERQPL